MMTGPENWKISYPIFIAAMAVIAFVNYLLIIMIERKNKSLKDQ
jgi:hypothetical protein